MNYCFKSLKLQRLDELVEVLNYLATDAMTDNIHVEYIKDEPHNVYVLLKIIKRGEMY